MRAAPIEAASNSREHHESSALAAEEEAEELVAWLGSAPLPWDHDGVPEAVLPRRHVHQLTPWPEQLADLKSEPQRPTSPGLPGLTDADSIGVDQWP